MAPLKSSTAMVVLLALLQLFSAESASPQGYDKILNDFDQGVSMGGVGWVEGWYTPCGDSYGTHQPVDFHAASVQNVVTASYQPVLPAAGCYEVLEWHPGKSPSCSAYLPKNALLTVYHGGKANKITLDQSVNGAQWNTIGRFDFALGQPQYVVASNRGGDLSCDSGSCWWIADALRFVFVGETCAAPATAADLAIESAARDTARLQSKALMAQPCADFTAELAKALANCEGVETCDSMLGVAECVASAAAFNSRFEEHMLQCMLLPDAAKALGEAPGTLQAVRLLTTCTMENAAAGDREADALRMTAAKTATDPSELSAAIKWDGKCDHFKKFALQVMQACSGVRCCADVMANPTCSYYANGLYSLFPNEAFNGCIDQVDIPCTCLLRKATACSLQGEMHEILYRTKWQPECVAPIMPYQLTPGVPNPMLKYACVGLSAVLVLLLVVVGCSQRAQTRRLQAAAIELQQRPVPCSVECNTKLSAVQVAQAPAVVHVVQNPCGAILIGQMVEKTAA